MSVHIRQWSYQRQCLARRAPTVEAALEAVVGVYSSHPSALLSLRARTRSFSPENMAAMEKARRALRTAVGVPQEIPFSELLKYMCREGELLGAKSILINPKEEV